MGSIIKTVKDKKIFFNERHVIECANVYKGYEYLGVFTPMGHRNGYVAINKNHPLYDAEDYYDDRISNLRMHGGCTFFDFEPTDCDSKDKWIGFDCAHCDDAKDIESLKKYYPTKDISYLDKIPVYGSVKTKEFVISECKNIINQLSDCLSDCYVNMTMVN